ncbi:serine/threonine-protein kinase 26-like [Physella acuta]|uniref:serine/threonine-protein kinase 26-like n=1 Tax=Physella acuta TaxID=109671 RepID=UPI0027DCA9E3|nr:serine/threonine-protein kinase 26-like [Physella acuta]
MEYVAQNTLMSYIIKTKKLIPEMKVKLFTKQILEGLSHLHVSKIVHTNLTSYNILLENEDNIKLTYYGVANMLEKTVYDPKKFQYLAPELKNNDNPKYTKKTDIWSAACIVLEMATGKPLDHNNNSDQNSQLSMLPINSSKQLKSFLKKTLNDNPKQRPSVRKLLQHELFMV